MGPVAPAAARCDNERVPLWLSEADVRAVLRMPELIETMEQALAAYSAGAVRQPVRSVIELRDLAFYALMPAYAPPVLGAKLVTVIHENAARGLPTHQAAIALCDPATGSLAAVLDGRYITEVRTAAVSAVSVRHLARPDCSVLAILGSGVQARSHWAALRLVRDFREVRAWSPTPEHLRAFVAEAGEPVRAAASPAEAVRRADVVVVATSSITPAIDDAWVSPGAHVIGIGACRPTHRELDPALVARARLVVDARASALAESGDVLEGIREGRFTAAHVAAELGEVARGRRPGRTAADQVTVFKSLGLAIEDLCAAELALRKARACGRGIPVPL